MSIQNPGDNNQFDAMKNRMEQDQQLGGLRIVIEAIRKTNPDTEKLIGDVPPEALQASLDSHPSLINASAETKKFMQKALADICLAPNLDDDDAIAPEAHDPIMAALDRDSRMTGMKMLIESLGTAANADLSQLTPDDVEQSLLTNSHVGKNGTNMILKSLRDIGRSTTME